MEDITREEFQKLSEDIVQVKNDVNTIKANTQLTASILSLLNSNDIITYVFSIARTERLCKALIICKTPTSAKELCDALGVKQSNIQRDVISKLIDSLLTKCDVPGRSTVYKRASYLDAIGFDKKAMVMYPSLKGMI